MYIYIAVCNDGDVLTRRFQLLTCADTDSKHIRNFVENPGVAVLTSLRRFKHVIVVAAMFLVSSFHWSAGHLCGGSYKRLFCSGTL